MKVRVSNLSVVFDLQSMTLFTNSNFIHHIVNSQGLETSFEKQHDPALQTLIELETRLIVETAIRFMRRDRRDILSLEDIELALREHNHQDLVVTPYGTYSAKDQYIVKEDPVIASPAALMKEQLDLMDGRQLEAPRLTGRWIYVRGKVPSTSENVNIKRLEQLKEGGKHEWEEKRKLCNIIKDNPYSYLTAEQSDFFINVSKAISGDSAQQGLPLTGDLTSLMPFLLKLLGSLPLNETAISFLLQLLDNKYIWRAVEFGTVKALNLLLAYKGPQSFRVGQKIAQIVKCLSEKYPVLRDIYVGYEDESYSTILKKIPFEIELGVPFEIDERLLQRCKLDSENNDQMAILCLKALLNSSSQLSIFRKLLALKKNTFIYWHPCPELKNDPYLAMY